MYFKEESFLKSMYKQKCKNSNRFCPFRHQEIWEFNIKKSYIFKVTKEKREIIKSIEKIQLHKRNKHIEFSAKSIACFDILELL